MGRHAKGLINPHFCSYGKLILSRVSMVINHNTVVDMLSQA